MSTLKCMHHGSRGPACAECVAPEKGRVRWGCLAMPPLQAICGLDGVLRRQGAIRSIQHQICCQLGVHSTKVTDHSKASSCLCWAYTKVLQFPQEILPSALGPQNPARDHHKMSSSKHLSQNVNATQARVHFLRGMCSPKSAVSGQWAYHRQFVGWAWRVITLGQRSARIGPRLQAALKESLMKEQWQLFLQPSLRCHTTPSFPICLLHLPSC